MSLFLESVKFVSFTKFGNLSAIVLLNTLSAPPSLSCAFGTLMLRLLDLLSLSQQVSEALFIAFQSVFSLLFRLGTFN